MFSLYDSMDALRLFNKTNNITKSCHVLSDSVLSDILLGLKDRDPVISHQAQLAAKSVLNYIIKH